VRDGQSLVLNGKRFAVVSLSAAYLAIHINIRQEAHLDLAKSVALASFAPATFHIETEAAGPVSARARFRQHGVELANRRENPGIGSWIRSRGPADRRLVDFDDLINEFQALDGLVRSRLIQGPIDISCERFVKDFVYERRFARAGDACYDGH